MQQEYTPIGCEHKLLNGLSAWQFQSEMRSNINGGNLVAIHVCGQCGDIRVVGYRTSEDGKHVDRFNETFDLHHASAIDPIIKAANFFNEETKWGRVSTGGQSAGTWINCSQRFPDDWESKHMRYVQDHYKVDTDLFEHIPRENSLCKIGGTGRLKYAEVEWLDESQSALPDNKDREIAFHKWVIENEYEINNRAQITHSIEQLHEIWEISLTNNK